MIAAFTLLLVANGCANKPEVPLSRDIGPAPVYLTPAQVPPPKPSPFEDARQLKDVIVSQNIKICSARKEWDETRDRLLAGQVVQGRAVALHPDCIPLPKERKRR